MKLQFLSMFSRYSKAVICCRLNSIQKGFYRGLPGSSRNFSVLQKKFNIQDTFEAWRRSEDNFVDLNLTEEDLEIILSAQERLSADQRCIVSTEHAQTFLTGRYRPPTSTLDKLMTTFDRHVMKGHAHYASRLFLKIIERCDDPIYLEMFGVDRKNYAQYTYWVVLHAWAFKRRLLFQRDDTINYFFWDLVWNSCMFRLASEENIKESMTKSSLDSVKEYCVGLMLGLEESLDQEKLSLGQFEWLLFSNVYDSVSVRPDEKKVREISAYFLYLNEFCLHLPTDEFRNSLFKIPHWPRTDLPKEVMLQAEIANSEKLSWTRPVYPDLSTSESADSGRH